jgi:hypothetical protein
MRHAESSAQLCPASNAKLESLMPIRFQKLIDVPGFEARQSNAKAILTERVIQGPQRASRRNEFSPRGRGLALTSRAKADRSVADPHVFARAMT